MKWNLKTFKKLVRNASRRVKKGVRNATRAAKKIFHRGGDPNATPPPPPPPPAPTPAPTPAPAPKKRRRSKSKGALRRVTNAVRNVGKRFRNTISSVFSKKTKRRRSKGSVQKGSSETPPKNAVPPTSPGTPAAPPA
jgi:hypothetical protein